MKLTFEIDTTDTAQVTAALAVLNNLNGTTALKAAVVNNNLTSTDTGTKAANATEIASAKAAKAEAAAKAKADTAKAEADALAAKKADAAAAAAAAEAEAEAAAKAIEDECPFDTEEEEVFTLEQVRGKLKAYAALKSKAAAVKILREIGGATSVSELPAENYGKVIEACVGA